MADQLPPPPVPADVDLRGHDWMPLYGERLFGSATWIESSDAARIAALRLWWHSFAKEKPAASLPDNDRLLAVYAGYGEVVRAWKKIKAEAMRGWVLCSDGRWYHLVVAEIAMESWQRQQDHQESNAAKTERQRRWRERLKALTAALRAAGKTPPKGASLETLEKMARDAGVDVYEASSEIGNTGQDKTEHNKDKNEREQERAPWARPIPRDWQPSDDDIAWAQKSRADIQAARLKLETEGFRNHALANNRTFHEVGPAWRNWIMKARIGGGGLPAHAGSSRPDNKPDYLEAFANGAASAKQPTKGILDT